MNRIAPHNPESTYLKEKVYHTDRPAKEDLFGRRRFAETAAETMLRQPLGEPLVVSIVGTWGSGKTTALHFARDILAQRQCKSAEFNPWRYAGEDILLYELFNALVRAIDPDKQVLTAWQEIGRFLDKPENPLLSIGGWAIGKKLPGADTIIKGVTGTLAAWLRPKIEKVREQAREHLLKSKLRVVVLIDDIDRLDANDVLSLFRVIKLSADLPNTTFVLAMDEDHVSEIIGKSIDGAIETGRKYIEKIVNVRLQLPAIPDYKLRDYTLGLLDEVSADSPYALNAEDRSRCRNIFDRLHMPFVTTPRTAKVLSNAYRFALGLLPGEVNPGDLLLLEATRILRPVLYERIRREMPDVVRGRSPFNFDLWDRRDEKEARIKEFWARFLDGVSPEGENDHANVKSAICSWFPQLAPYYSGQENDDWRGSKRLCANAYFWRFFSGNIEDDDVRDYDVLVWIDGLREDTIELSRHDLNRHLETRYKRAFVAKLRQFLANEPDKRKRTAVILAELSSGFSADQSDSLGGGLRYLTAQIAADAVEAQSDANSKSKFAIELFKSAPDFGWSFELLSLLPDDCKTQRVGGNENGSWKPAEAELFLTRKVLNGIVGQPPSDSDSIRKIIWAIWRNREGDDTKKRVSESIALNPTLSLIFLAAGCGYGQAEEQRRPGHCWSWHGEKSLREMSEIIDLKTLECALRIVVPELKFAETSSLSDSRDRGHFSLDEIALKFLNLYTKRSE